MKNDIHSLLTGCTSLQNKEAYGHTHCIQIYSWTHKLCSLWTPWANHSNFQNFLRFMSQWILDFSWYIIRLIAAHLFQFYCRSYYMHIPNFSFLFPKDIWFDQITPIKTDSNFCLEMWEVPLHSSYLENHWDHL